MKLKKRVKLVTILFMMGFAGVSGGCVSAFFKGIEQEMGLGTEEVTDRNDGEFEQLKALVAQLRAALEARLAEDDEDPLPDVVVDPDMVSVRKSTATGVGGAILTAMGVMFWKKFGFAMIPGMSK